MDSRRIGLRLVELAKAGRDAEAVNELYADNIESVEIISNTTEEPQVWKGIDGVREKHAWWESVATIHSVEVDGPFAGHGSDVFVVGFSMDVTVEGERNTMREVGVFTLEEGKIVKEVYLGLAS